MHHSINSKLIGLSFLVHFILRTSAIFAVEGAPSGGGRNRLAGETGGDREGPSPPGPVNSISWGDPIYNKMGPFYLSWTVFQQLK